MLLEIVANIAGVLLSLVLTRAIFKRWPKTGKWSLHRAEDILCPSCGEPTPKKRVPTDMHEMLWGGSTCVRCGTQYDKQGNERRNY